MKEGNEMENLIIDIEKDCGITSAAGILEELGYQENIIKIDYEYIKVFTKDGIDYKFI